MTDATLLAALLRSDRLSTVERRAFGSMSTGLGKYGSLTERQRAWAQRVGARIGLPVAHVEATPDRSAFDPEPGKGEAKAPTRPRCPVCKHFLAMHRQDGKTAPCRWMEGRNRCRCRGKRGKNGARK